MAQTEKQRMEELLGSEVIGHLGLSHDGETYIVPLNYAYLDGKILFHCALEGLKLDFIRANPRVCLEVSRMEGTPTPHGPESCDAPFASVICWGTARIVDDIDERVELLNRFQARYDTPAKQRPPIGIDRAEKCGAVEITVERMTGRFWTSGDDQRCEWEG